MYKKYFFIIILLNFKLFNPIKYVNAYITMNYNVPFGKFQ